MRMMHMTTPGPPEVLKLAERPDPVPGPGKVLIGVEAAGVIMMDTWFRSGKVPAELPFTPGFEVGGQVLAVGDSSDASLAGQRVVAGTGGSGGYAMDGITVISGLGVPATADIRRHDAEHASPRPSWRTPARPSNWHQ